MFTLKRSTALAALGLAILVPTSQASAQAAGEWRDAKQVFEKICVYCHQGGDGHEASVAQGLLGRQIPAEYVVHVVRNGLRAMPEFRPTELSDEELKSLGRMIQDSPPVPVAEASK